MRVTRYSLESQRYWYHDAVVYIFDPTRATDLIDLWNLRLEPRPVLPVPVAWAEALAADIRAVIRETHRPVRGNPHGVMHHATVEFARSLSKAEVEVLVQHLNRDLSRGSLSIKHWRNRIWYQHRDERMHRDERLEVTAEERRTTLQVKTEIETTANFEALTPSFASQYGGRDWRWVNAVQLKSFEQPERTALVASHTLFMPGFR